MGEIRTPRPIYENNYVMEFYVKDKHVFYKISKWAKDGSTLALLFDKQLHDLNPRLILQSVMAETKKESQSFSSVSRQ